MTREQLDALWRDQRYWSGIGMYRCPDDPRVVVPKRRRWAGWTINFAHPLAFLVLAASVLIAVGPFLVAAAAGLRDPGRLMMVLGASIASLIIFSAYLASRGE